MKRILFALTMLALVLPAVPRANGAEVSIDLFYTNLSGGSWIDADDYGYGWQPDVAVNDPDWRPYADGYWAYTDYGWTWVSYEDWGWACYHYGRWARLADYGWVWFPGADLVWGPAWVSWRFGGNYCGWAPLPPRGPGIVYEGQPIGGQVDIEFDIGPAYYNFVDIRYIGEPVLRTHIYAPTYNVTYINQTVNVTNITVKNKVVYNYGPDYNVLVQHSSRPIQRLRIEREQNVDFSAAAKSGGLTKVQGDKLVVSVPERIQKSAKQIAPPTVKTKVTKDKVKIEKGWSVAGDEKAQAELKQKIRSQDLKKVPPPTAGAPAQQPPGGAASPAGAEPPAAAPAATAAAPPTEEGKHGRRGQETQPGVTGTPETSPAGEGSPAGPPDGRRKGRPGERITTPPPPTTEGVGTTPAPERQTGKRGRPMPPESSPPTGEATGAPQTTPMGQHRMPERGQLAPGSNEPVEQPGGPGQGRHQRRRFEGTPPPQEGADQAGTQYQGRPGKHRAERAYPQQGGSPAGQPESPDQAGGKPGKKAEQAYQQQGGPPAGQPPTGKPEGGNKKKGEASPAPTP